MVLGKEKPVEETTLEYEKLKHYIFGLEEHLAEAQKQAYRLVKRHKGMNFERNWYKISTFPNIIMNSRDQWSWAWSGLKT